MSKLSQILANKQSTSSGNTVVQKAPISTSSAPAFQIGSSEAKELWKSISESEFNVTPDHISDAFNLLINSVPDGARYLAGEVKVHMFDENNITFESLLAAGTLILDAVLFMALKDDGEYGGLFDMQGPLYSDKSDSALIRQTAYLAFIASIEHYLTKGVLPGMGNQNDQLSRNIVQRTLSETGITTSGQLGQILSSAKISKFPRTIYLGIDLGKIDKTTGQRIALSPAGTKFMRYLYMVGLFIGDSTMTSKNAAAKKIYDFVKSIKPEQLIKFHPDHESSVRKPQKCSAKISVMLMKNLNSKGQTAVLTYINTKNMEALKKDTLMYAMVDGKVVCPGVNDPEFNDDCITVESLENFLK